MTDSAQALWTIKRLLEWTVEHFKKHDCDSSRLDAEVLLAEALGCPRIMLYTRFDEVPDEQPLQQFRDWVKQRTAGAPVAYLVGHREFYSLSFEVSDQVLIPRPETEHVVMAAITETKNLSARPIRIMDIGTGSGCIAVTLAHQLAATLGPEAVVVAATDLSNTALEVAQRNAERHGVDRRIRFFQGDLFAAMPRGSQPVHLIVSNPPYIGTGEINTLSSGVRDHEPHAALFGGHDGTDVIKRLVSEAPDWLLPGGSLIFETSPIIMDRCLEMANRDDRYQSVRMEKDFAGLPRIVIASVK